jgi:hypothetical protein
MRGKDADLKEFFTQYETLYNKRDFRRVFLQLKKEVLGITEIIPEDDD